MAVRESIRVLCIIVDCHEGNSLFDDNLLAVADEDALLRILHAHAIEVVVNVSLLVVGPQFADSSRSTIDNFQIA